jgi:hydrogenase expression/formation protein HypC
MCLGALAEVVRVDAADAEVVSGGRRTTVSLLVLDDPVTVGDWLVVHAGFALERLTAAEARDAARIRATTGEEES